MQESTVELRIDPNGWAVITQDEVGLHHKAFSFKNVAIDYARRECDRLGIQHNEIISTVPLT